MKKIKTFLVAIIAILFLSAQANAQMTYEKMEKVSQENGIELKKAEEGTKGVVSVSTSKSADKFSTLFAFVNNKVLYYDVIQEIKGKYGMKATTPQVFYADLDSGVYIINVVSYYPDFEYGTNNLYLASSDGEIAKLPSPKGYIRKVSIHDNKIIIDHQQGCPMCADVTQMYTTYNFQPDGSVLPITESKVLPSGRYNK